MLELASQWWHVKNRLDQYRRDMANLPTRIANERAQLGSGGHYAYVHSQSLAKAEQDLRTAKEESPKLERHLRDLEQEYNDSGFDKIDYAAWTPGETAVGGKDIEKVGRAVGMGGKPAGLQATNIEFDLAIAGPLLGRLARAATKKALGRSLRRTSFDKPIEPSPSSQQVDPGRGGRYGYLEDPAGTNSGKDFTSSQRKIIVAENERQNGGVLRDDRTGEILVQPQQRKIGVPAPPNEAQVDHVYPKSRGGPNTYSIAEVGSRLNNLRKGKRLE